MMLNYLYLAVHRNYCSVVARVPQKPFTNYCPRTGEIVVFVPPHMQRTNKHAFLNRDIIYDRSRATRFIDWHAFPVSVLNNIHVNGHR